MEKTSEKEKKMKNTGKSMFSVFEAGVYATGFLIAVLFSQETEAIMPIGNEGVVAGRGWDMAMCRIPMGPNTTGPVYFADGETIGLPIHINRQNDEPDVRDIYINGSPVFLERVKMGESRYTDDGNDKYDSVMSCFQGGIYFDRPDSNIGNEAVVQSAIDRFRDCTPAAYIFEPNTVAAGVLSPKCPAVQIEFYIDKDTGEGMVRIDPNCTVKLVSNAGVHDYNIVTGSNPMQFQKYNIYAYHYKKTTEPSIIVPVTDTYVTQNTGGHISDPAGQIFVNGNVVIGGDSVSDPNQVVKGKIFVVATGNIWIGDNILVDGVHDVNGMPTEDNPNLLGLIARGVVKVVDPGLAPASPPTISGYTYRPIGIVKPGSSGRYLPEATVVEAGITIGGGGFGAENVNSSGGRRAYSPPMDDLYVHGAIAEVVRGIVGIIGVNGYLKHYSYDKRWNPVICLEAIAGDLNGDCVVDFVDVGIMAAHWLENNLSGDEPPVCMSPIEGDINNDCTVDFIDFAIEASHWLESSIEEG